MNSKANDYLREAAEIYEARNKVYGDNYKLVGKVMEGLFPDGVQLNSVDDYNRFHLLELAVVKLTRYCNNWDKGGHEDSLKDLSVYAMMILEVDNDIQLKLPLDFKDAS